MTLSPFWSEYLDTQQRHRLISRKARVTELRLAVCRPRPFAQCGLPVKYSQPMPRLAPSRKADVTWCPKSCCCSLCVDSLRNIILDVLGLNLLEILRPVMGSNSTPHSISFILYSLFRSLFFILVHSLLQSLTTQFNQYFVSLLDSLSHFLHLLLCCNPSPSGFHHLIYP